MILIESFERTAEAVDADETVIGAAGLPRQRHLDALCLEPFAQSPLRFHMRRVRPDRLRKTEDIMDMTVEYPAGLQLLDCERVGKSHGGFFYRAANPKARPNYTEG